MNIFSISSFPDQDKSDIKSLWEENMHESWKDYDGADIFVVKDLGECVGGFAVYQDESDGIKGIYCSGWADRHKKVPCDKIIKQIVANVGDLYFKTDQRAAKFLLEKIGKKIKTTDRFVYYIVKDD